MAPCYGGQFLCCGGSNEISPPATEEDSGQPVGVCIFGTQGKNLSNAIIFLYLVYVEWSTCLPWPESPGHLGWVLTVPQNMP